jgi:hypothetical protein
VFREGVGEKNVAVGDGAMYSSTGADRNIAFGAYTLFNSNGDQNIFIGDRVHDNTQPQWTGSKFLAIGSETHATGSLLFGYHGTAIPKFLNVNGNLNVLGSGSNGVNNTIGRLIVSQSVNDQTDGAFVLHSVRNGEDLIRMYEYGGQAVIKAPRGNGLFEIEGGLGGNDYLKLNQSIIVYPSAGAYNRENGVDISANTKITGSLVVTGSVTITDSIIAPNATTFVQNTTDTFTGSAAVQQVVTLTQAEYNAIGSPNANTLYIISGSTPINAAAFATTGSNTFVGNQIITGSVTATLGFTGSLLGTASFATFATGAGAANSATSASYALIATSASFATTAISSSFASTAISSSFATSASQAVSSSFATTASFALTATSASYALNATSASYALNATSASFADNATSASYALNATSASYALNATSASYALNATSASLAQTASFYDLSNVTQNAVFSGSVRGDVSALSISSQTASLDCSTGNFFTLQLVSGSNTFVNPSNILPGQTINLRVNTTGSGTVTFPSSVKQVSGSAYVPTTTTGVDIVTFISFDSTSLNLSNIKNFV